MSKMHFSKINSFLFIGFVTLFIMLASCKKAVENKLIGKWTVVNVNDINSSYTEQWEFTKEQKVYISVIGSPTDTGQYITNVKLGKKYVEIADCNLESNNHKWRIMKLTKKDMHLIIETDHGLTFKEFVKAP